MRGEVYRENNRSGRGFGATIGSTAMMTDEISFKCSRSSHKSIFSWFCKFRLMLQGRVMRIQG